jgi:hypothetical protein
MRRHYHCGHRCPQRCSEDCGNCQVIIPSVLLPCGHRASKIQCHEAMDPTKIKCNEACMRQHSHCGHLCPQRCWEDCGNCQVRIPSVTLPCGHTARNLQCHETIDLTRMKCNEACMRWHYHCGHRCPQRCWADCGSCKVTVYSVELPCGHTALNLQCHETIDLAEIICRQEICGQLLSYGNMVNIQPSSASFTWAEDVEREFGMLTIR